MDKMELKATWKDQSGSGCSGTERERISRCTYGDADSVPVRPDPDRKDEKAGNRVVDESFLSAGE